MEESYEYANEFGKQGRKNPRYIPIITINRKLFSRDKIYAHAQSSFFHFFFKTTKSFSPGILQLLSIVGYINNSSV